MIPTYLHRNNVWEIVVFIKVHYFYILDDRYSRMLQEHADLEWKHSRSVVWMQYLESQRMLPNPLNILPNVRSIMDIALWIIAVFRCQRGVKAGCSADVSV